MTETTEIDLERLLTIANGDMRTGEEIGFVLRQLPALLSKVSEMKEALDTIDALDAEGGVNGMSRAALGGIVNRMGAIARTALASIPTGGGEDSKKPTAPDDCAECYLSAALTLQNPDGFAMLVDGFDGASNKVTPEGKLSEALRYVARINRDCKPDLKQALRGLAEAADAAIQAGADTVEHPMLNRKLLRDIKTAAQKLVAETKPPLSTGEGES